MAQVTCLALILPYAALTLLAQIVLGTRAGFQGAAQALAIIPGIIGIYLRWAFYYLFIKRCSWDVTIEFGSFLSSREAVLGNHVYIGAYSILGQVVIEDGVKIASGVSVPSGRYQHHHTRNLETLFPDGTKSGSDGVFTRIRIGANSWIGERAVILANIGANCIVGAGAVVSRDIPDGSVAVGVPARILGGPCREPLPQEERTQVDTASSEIVSE